MANREKFVDGFSSKYLVALNEGLSTAEFCERYVDGGNTAENRQRLSQKLAQMRKSKKFQGTPIPSLKHAERSSAPSEFVDGIRKYNEQRLKNAAALDAPVDETSDDEVPAVE